MKIDFNKKKIWGLIIFVVICLTVIVISIINKKDLLKLKTESINVEYGQSVSTDLNDYLDFSDLSNKEKKDVLKNTKYKSNVKNELETITNQDGTISQKDRGFVKIGDYKITLTYQNEVETIKVKVRDTVTPQLSGPDNIEIIQGTDLTTFDFKSLITATDLAQLNDIIIDYSAIDTNTLGEYKVKVSVEDVNKNKAKKEFNVTVVVAPLVIEQESTTNTTTNKKGNADTSNRSSNNTNSSSSSSSNKGNFNSGSTENNGNTDGSNLGNNGESSGGETKPEEPNPPKIKIYWAKCEYCGYYIESTISIDDVINKIKSNNSCTGNSIGEHRRYRYGATER
ncbi:hypothetical protein [Thomasclavelia spiroformis]|uniref:hypothetical protein n=1 Tax=Thomasclavelia spiroformis TaxID=29348 RepID=UPI00241F6BB2|nr:hypothetical protein [Thomasclavelia spiroformis]MBS6115063.1 hypothetical protein [Thomasclavelia spiroformis]